MNQAKVQTKPAKAKKKAPEKLKLFNKTIRTDKSFKNQTKIDRIELAKFKKEKKADRYFYDIETKKILKMDIKKDEIQPYNQVFKEWKIIKKPKKDIIKANTAWKNKVSITKDLSHLYDNNANINVLIQVKNLDGTPIKVKYNGNINDMVNSITNLLINKNVNTDIINKDDIINDSVKNMLIFPVEYGDDRDIINFQVKLTYDIRLSDQDLIKIKSFSFSGKYKDLNDYLVDKSRNYLKPFDLPPNLENDCIINAINSKEYLNQPFTGNYMTLNPENMRMRDKNAYDICNLFNNIITIKPTEDNCVIQYLKNQYKKISIKRIKSLGNNEGVSSSEIVDFTSKFNIKTIIYDIEGNIICSNYPDKINKSYKSLVGISYNNHFYPSEHNLLNKVSIPKQTIIKKELDSEFKDLINNKVIPSNIRIFLNDKDKHIKISSFGHNDKTYIYNKDYNVCLAILEKFGLKDKIQPTTNLKNIHSILESAYIQENINSFFKCEYSKGGYNFINKNVNIEKHYSEFITIDHNKFYSNCLKDLNSLLSVDMRLTQPLNIYINTKTDKDIQIISNHLYKAKPFISCLLMPKTEFYTGSHLKYCYDHNLNFEIFEELETLEHPNYYNKLIYDIYNHLETEDHSNAKDIINIMIGKFEQTEHVINNIDVLKLCNFDERQKQKGSYIKYTDNVYLKIKKEHTIKKIFNKSPIAIQLKDLSRIKIFEKIQELKISEKDLINIQTDSITYINRGQKPKLSVSNWTMWKSINKPIEYFLKLQQNGDNEIMDDENITFNLKPAINRNILYNCYAGSGKTYTIINDIIPSLNKDDYIIITPSHNSAKEYYKLNLNCRVIQGYIHTQTIPTEQNIIIDEIGLCDKEAHNIIYKCFLMNKRIYGLGDFRQLLPINEMKHFDCSNYLNHIFNEIKDIRTNYRNNFTIDYYDSLINAKQRHYICNEVCKYTVDDYKNADIIICGRNRTKNKYNKLMIDYLNIKFGEIGCKIICNTNNLRQKGIYNNFDYIIKSINDINIILDDDTSITQEELKNNFELGYAITLFKAQGQQFTSFYYPLDDFDMINNREAYTLISRLKYMLTDETIKRNKAHTNNIKIDNKDETPNNQEQFIIRFD